jgi:hypothetical protein
MQSVFWYACVSLSTNSYAELSWYRFHFKPNMKNWRTLASFFLIIINFLWHHNGLLPGPVDGRVDNLCTNDRSATTRLRWYMRNYRMTRKSADGIDTCAFIVRESDWSGRGSGGYDSKKHLFHIYYFAHIVLLKLSTVRKPWWTEICASQSSGGWQYWAVDGPVHHCPVPAEPCFWPILDNSC